MKSSALGLALALSVVGSACALHPVADPGYDPYYGSGGEAAAYEYQQRAAWQQQRAYEHAAAREDYERRLGWERAHREHDRWEREQAMRAAHERSAWQQQPQPQVYEREREMAHVQGHGAFGRPAPMSPRVVVQPAPRAPEPARVAPAPAPAASRQPARVAPRAAQLHRSVAYPE